MKKPLLLLLVTLFLLPIAHAQSLSHTLLWRISGNGLQQPAYLYGTMHVTDERVFNLGDSLYRAIEQSEGFAIEMNPEEMLAYLIDEIQNEVDNAHQIRELVDERVYRKYGSALSKKLKKPVDKITARDIFREKNKWITQSYKNGKMTTFLDAYLLDIARRQGKWTGGIEDMADQKNLAGLIDESDIREIADERQPSSTNLLRAYIDHNLNAIDSMINLSDSSYIDALLTRRNHKMAARMDSMSRIRSMVFAVGAAHLPGQEGLIALLRARGFEVNPVFASRPLRPSEYTLKPIDLPWVEVRDTNNFYRALMPGKPGNINSYGIEAMKMYFDIFNSTGYITFAMSMPYDKKEGDSMAEAMADNIFTARNKKKSGVVVSGVKGIALEQTDEEGYKHGYVLHRGNVIYMVVALASKRTPETDKALNKFLDSYHINENSIDTTLSAIAYTDSIRGFRVLLPALPVVSPTDKGEENGSIHSHMLISNDLKTGTYYFIGVNEAKPGYYIPNDSNSLTQIRIQANEQIKGAVKDTMYFRDGHRVLEYNGLTQQSNVTMRTYYEFRGNRWYALIALYNNNQQDPGVARFFQSFELLEYPKRDWQQRTSQDGLISAWTPTPLLYTAADSTTDNSAKYEAFDTVSADGYDVVVSDLGKYFWQNSDTAFWNVLVRNSVDANDTLLSQKEISNGNYKGVEIIMKEKGSANLQRKRMLYYNDQLYMLLTMQPEQALFSSDANKFFEAFRFNKPQSVATSYLQSKAALLLQDIASSDSATRSTARAALSSANFAPQDVPALHNAILRSYPSDSNQYQTTNQLLEEVLQKLNQPATLAFAQSHYPLAQDPDIKNALLQLISYVHTRENYDTLAILLLQSPPLKSPGYRFTRELTDSLALTATIFPRLLPMLQDSMLSHDLMTVARSLTDSNLLDRPSLLPYEPMMLSLSEGHYGKQLQDSATAWSNLNLITLLGKLNTKNSNDALQSWSSLAVHPYLQQEAIRLLLQNKQPLSPTTLQQLASNRSTRVDLYTLLKQHQQLSLYPKGFATQKSFAEAMAFNAAYEDTDEEPRIVYGLGQKNYTINGSSKRFYFFRVDYAPEEGTPYSMLACAGPFATNADNLSEDDATGYVDNENNFDEGSWRQMADEMVDQAIGE